METPSCCDECWYFIPGTEECSEDNDVRIEDIFERPKECPWNIFSFKRGGLIMDRHREIILEALRDYRMWYQEEETEDDTYMINEIDDAIDFIRQED